MNPYRHSPHVQACIWTAHLSLTEGLDADDIVQLLCANDRLHVEHLAAYAVHQYREEIGVAEVQSALRRNKMKDNEKSCNVHKTMD